MSLGIESSFTKKLEEVWLSLVLECDVVLARLA